MDFITFIGTEKVSDALFPWLEWNDLLRLRRTCKTTKTVADVFIKTSGITCNSQVEINEKDKSLHKFQKLAFPITKIYLNNAISGPDFFEIKDFSPFMDTFGKSITHLRVYQLSRFIVRNEWTFLDKALTNITHLEIDRIIDDKKRVPRTLLRRLLKKNKIDNVYISDSIMIFPSLDNLKCVKIGSEDDSNINLKHVAMFTCTILTACKSLEYLSVPSSLVQFKLTKTVEVKQDDNFCDYFGDVIHYITQRMTKNSTFTAIKYLEFGPNFCNVDDYDINYPPFPDERVFAVKNFVKLVNLSLKYNMSLGNVDSAFFVKYKKYSDIYSRAGEFVRSLVNIRAPMLEWEMNNVEKLVIDRTSRSSMFPKWTSRPQWPNLKILHINADFPMLFPVWQRDFLPNITDGTFIWTTVDHLYKLLFRDIVRASLVELAFNVKTFLSDCNDETTTSSLSADLTFPESIDIISACPNLKILTISKWHGGNQPLISFWEGLLMLEVVCLDSCENAGTVTFVGANSKDPVFLKLKRLKKFTLRGLDKMPKITDLAFKLVFRHLKLKEFYMECEQPLKLITNDGLRSLLTSDFANSIEKFPFDGFELDETISPYEEMKEIEAQFRSSYMI